MLNNRTFEKDVLARGSYEHAVKVSNLSLILQKVSFLCEDNPRNIRFGCISGYFRICLDGDVSSKERCRVFKFALSNPGNSEINVMDKSTNVAEASASECSKQMRGDKPPPIFFAVDDSHYAVYAKIKGDTKHSRTWCFVVQKYDPSEWSKTFMNRLQRVLP